MVVEGGGKREASHRSSVVGRQQPRHCQFSIADFRWKSKKPRRQTSRSRPQRIVPSYRSPWTAEDGRPHARAKCQVLPSRIKIITGSRNISLSFYAANACDCVAQRWSHLRRYCIFALTMHYLGGK